jgi:ATP-binding cassette subfamily B multidrug efflux pump
VPRLRDRSKAASAERSLLTGRIVDSYTNILTVKLFARAEEEDSFIRDGVARLTEAFRRQMRLITLNGLLLSTLNALMLTSLGVVSILLWQAGEIGLGTVAAARPMGPASSRTSARCRRAMMTASPSRSTVADAPVGEAAAGRQARRDALRARPHSGYGQERRRTSNGLRPGDRAGRARRPGWPFGCRQVDAGEPAVALLRPGGGPHPDRRAGHRAGLAGDPARADRRGDAGYLAAAPLDPRQHPLRPPGAATRIIAAAKRANARTSSRAWKTRWRAATAIDAHVGERGVKLSGGQRQRIAIARVMLKNAPILVLDEATSALDSEVEAAIQSNLERLMQGKTVSRSPTGSPPSRHGPSDRARQEGRIVEQGTHAQLVAANGIYADLWARQSGRLPGGRRINAVVDHRPEDVLAQAAAIDAAIARGTTPARSPACQPPSRSMPTRPATPPPTGCACRRI